MAMLGNSQAAMVGRGKERLKAREFRIWLSAARKCGLQCHRGALRRPTG